MDWTLTLGTLTVSSIRKKGQKHALGRWAKAVVALLSLSLLVLSLLVPRGIAHASGTVTINAATTYQTKDGIGIAEAFQRASLCWLLFDIRAEISLRSSRCAPRNVRKLHTPFNEPLCRVARVVVQKSSQDIPPLHRTLSWLVVC